MYSPNSNPDVPFDVEAGGASWQPMALPSWPFYSQMHDWTSDGQPDENRSLNCGPECVAMVVDWLTGVELPADYIKDVMLGQGTTGTTGPQHIQPFLANHCSTRTHLHLDTERKNVLWRLWHALTNQNTAIVLMKWDNANNSPLHWRCLIGMSPGTVVFADPWDAMRKEYTYTDFMSLYQSMIIVVNRQRCGR